MRLHTISLYTFKYVGHISKVKFLYDQEKKQTILSRFKYQNINSSFAFKYGIPSTVIYKNNDKLFYKATSEIDISNTTLLYKFTSNMDIKNECPVCTQIKKINKDFLENPKNLILDKIKRINKKNTVQINTTIKLFEKALVRNFKTIDHMGVKINDWKELHYPVKEFLYKISLTSLENKYKGITIHYNNNLQNCNDIKILKNKIINLKNINENLQLNKTNENLQLYRLKIRELNIDYSLKEINRVNRGNKKLNLIKSLKELNREKIKNISSIENKFFVTRYDFHKLKTKLNKLFLTRVIDKNMDKSNVQRSITKVSRNIFKDNTVSNINKDLKQCSIDTSWRLFYKDPIKFFKQNKSIKEVIKDSKNIFLSKTKLNYKCTVYHIQSINATKGLYSIQVKNIDCALNIKDLNKYLIKDILKNTKEYLLFYKRLLNILKNSSKELKDIKINLFNKENISKDLLLINKINLLYKQSILKGINGSKPIDISLSNSLNLNKKLIDIKCYSTKNYLEVVKRWWVLFSTYPKDRKILPFDYDYMKNPIEVNNRILPYLDCTKQQKHPISYMPYLTNANLGGIDLNYGIKEIDVSIEVMVDMINIVGMIIEHSSSQFKNISGKEAIEFIMELLLDWIRLDHIRNEMIQKNSYEDYLRCYRWIRWEAENIWFMADKDYPISKNKGIKYANMLLEQLSDYMKCHHFDEVPLWRKLKNMDIERQFNRQAKNGDLIKKVDKTKGKRKYYIETKRILGGRKNEH